MFDRLMDLNLSSEMSEEYRIRMCCMSVGLHYVFCCYLSSFIKPVLK